MNTIKSWRVIPLLSASRWSCSFSPAGRRIVVCSRSIGYSFFVVDEPSGPFQLILCQILRPPFVYCDPPSPKGFLKSVRFLRCLVFWTARSAMYSNHMGCAIRSSLAPFIFSPPSRWLSTCWRYDNTPTTCCQYVGNGFSKVLFDAIMSSH